MTRAEKIANEEAEGSAEALIQAMYKATNPHWKWTAGLTSENRPVFERECSRLLEELSLLGYKIVKVTE